MVTEAIQVKVLTVGPPSGRIVELIAKVNAINSKYGPFAILLILGDLFTPYRKGDEMSSEESDLLSGRLQSPIPIYFALPPSPLHPDIRTRLASLIGGGQDIQTSEKGDDQQPIKVTESLYFMRKQSVSLLPYGVEKRAGIRVAVAGGQWEAQHWSESVGKEEGDVESIFDPFMTSASIDKLLRHPSFRQRNTPQTSMASEEEPTTLAAARAQMAKLSKSAEEEASQADKPPIDVLLTNTWPNGVTMFSNPDKLPHPTSRTWGTPAIAQLVQYGQPRYHFSIAPGSVGRADDDKVSFGVVGLDSTEEGKQLRRNGVFWEREPFRTEGNPNAFCNVTRFVSLARFANEKKARWFMALNLTCAESAAQNASAAKVPDNVTPNPFAAPSLTESAKRKEIGDEMDSGQNFRWGENKRSNKHHRTGPSGLPNRPNVDMPDRPTRTVHAIAPKDCWFCLSNPQCAKHLIVAIGTECYVAMPKGQLPQTSEASSPVPGGGHVLIIPIEHFPSLLGHAEVDLVKPIAREMDEWRSALKGVYECFSAVMVSWEICRTTNTRAGHMQCQVVPLPRSKAAGLEHFFRQAAQKYGYTLIEEAGLVKEFLEISEDPEERGRKSDYFRLDLHDKTWIMPLQGGKRFNLQFPRETLASYLGVPGRADWKVCARSEAIEEAETRAFKTAFEPFAKAITD